jgi:hypothetical protein
MAKYDGFGHCGCCSRYFIFSRAEVKLITFEDLPVCQECVERVAEAQRQKLEDAGQLTLPLEG